MVLRTTKNLQTLRSYFDSLNISTEKCTVLEVTNSYHQTFHLIVLLLRHDRNKICATARQSLDCGVVIRHM